MLVEEHESWCNLCSIEPGTRLIEFSGALNLEHEVPTIHILHDKKEAVLKGEEKMPFSESIAAAHTGQQMYSEFEVMELGLQRGQGAQVGEF